MPWKNGTGAAATPPPFPTTLLVVLSSVLFAVASGCSGEGSDDSFPVVVSDAGTDARGDTASDTAPLPNPDATDTGRDASDTGRDADTDPSNACKSGPSRRIDCADRVEASISSTWRTTPQGSNLRAEPTSTALFGDRAVRLTLETGSRAGLIWEPDSPVDARGESGRAGTLRVALHGDNPNGYGWRRATPTVRIDDAQGESVTIVPPRGNDELVPSDATSWRWLDVPLRPRDGWTYQNAGTDAPIDLSAIERVIFSFRTFGSGFQVTLDGLVFTAPRVHCAYDCPGGCSGRGTCAPSDLRCDCEFGAVGQHCGRCGEGFEEAGDGSCELVESAIHDEWPNPSSQTTGDAWLRAHHGDVDVLRPRVLVLNFANQSSMDQVKQLVEQIVRGFELASTPAGSDGPAQLQYEIATYVDLRNGRADNPEAPEDWPYDNSTLFPRKEDPGGSPRFHYAEMFSEEFARHYGYERSGGSGHRPLCELVESGAIHDVWIVGAHADDDAVPAEVLEYKQRYTRRNNPIPDSFSPCAGNGCFRKEVSPCGRSVRIGFINYKRGPGCYLHNIGHLTEWLNSHHVVPTYSRWYDRYAGMNLDERFDLPIDSLYAVECDETPCIEYPNPSTAVIRHQGKSYRIDGWDQACGNTHFPPNAQKHYDYENSGTVQSSCQRFGRRSPESCRAPASDTVTQQQWAELRAKAPDCGGGFLVWWYRRMPARGTPHQYAGGESMPSFWPYLFY